MLAQFLDIAMELANYDIIEDEDAYWGEIPGLQGVWARHQTLAGCQRELREALSDWIALRLRLGLEIPEIARINLNGIGVATHV
jgi:predicted RNase H-like HicB family nuclease